MQLKGKVRKERGALATIFVAFNSLLCVLAIALLALTIWQAVPASVSFLSGVSVISYSFLSVGFAIFVTSLVGYVSEALNNPAWSYAFVVIVLVDILLQISLFVTCVIQIKTINGMVNQTWIEANQETRNYIQTKLECCGIEDYTEHKTSEMLDSADVSDNDIDASCFTITSNDTYLLHQIGCRVPMYSWYKEQYWIVLLLISPFILIQMVTYILSCVLFSKRETAKQKNLKTFSKNVKVVSLAKKWQLKVRKVTPNSSQTTPEPDAYYIPRSSLSQVWQKDAMDSLANWQPVDGIVEPSYIASTNVNDCRKKDNLLEWPEDDGVLSRVSHFRKPTVREPELPTISERVLSNSMQTPVKNLFGVADSLLTW